MAADIAATQPALISRTKMTAGRPDRQRQQRNRIQTAAQRFKHLEIEIFVDGDAEIAQRHPRQIDRVEYEEKP